MKTILCSLLSAGLLSLSPAAARAMAVRAQVPTGAQVQAWVVPIAQTIRSYGPAKMADLKVQSLTYFSTLSLSLTLKIETDPTAAGRLLEWLQTVGHSPDSFAKLREDERVLALQRAAERAETEAEREAERTLSGYKPGKLTYEAMAENETAVNRLWAEDLPYLSEATRVKINSFLEEAELVRKARSELFDAFTRDLPKKIAAGAFDARNTYRKVEGGWMAADISPVARYKSLTEAFGSRIEGEIDRAQAGPWSYEMLGTMADALDQDHVVKALREEGGEETRAALRAMVAEARTAIERRTSRPDAKLGRALAAVKRYHDDGAVPASGHVRAIYEHYDTRFHGIPGFAVLYRVADWMAKGDAAQGYPAWEELDKLKDLSYKQAQRRSIKAMAVLIAQLVAMPVMSAFDIMPGGWLLVPFLLVFFGTLGAFVYFLIQRDKLGWFHSEAEYRMNDFLRQL